MTKLLEKLPIIACYMYINTPICELGPYEYVKCLINKPKQVPLSDHIGYFIFVGAYRSWSTHPTNIDKYYYYSPHVLDDVLKEIPSDRFKKIISQFENPHPEIRLPRVRLMDMLDPWDDKVLKKYEKMKQEQKEYEKDNLFFDCFTPDYTLLLFLKEHPEDKQMIINRHSKL